MQLCQIDGDADNFTCSCIMTCHESMPIFSGCLLGTNDCGEAQHQCDKV